MSSTQRGYERHEKDYYRTPIDKIIDFVTEIKKYEPDILNGIILDPCAGGDRHHEMSYPAALMQCGVDRKNIHTIDIREDSRADLIEDYLNIELNYKPNLIITNPPFSLAIPIIEKALNDVDNNGFVVMLQRLNFFGGKNKRWFWQKQMPKYTMVHHRRMSFTDDGKTDSIEYAHFVFQKNYYPDFTKLKVI